MRIQVLVLLLALLSQSALAGSIDYWDTQRKGANFFPNNPRPERFRDAVEAGILLGRLAANKWLNGRPKEQLGDFLLGPKDAYSGIVEKDLTYLIHVLDDANKAGMKIVFTMLSLPGSRWLQHNCVEGACRQQYDLWNNFKYHEQTASFWRDLARALRSHPAVVGYNIINEPCPERATTPAFRDWYTMSYQKWYQTVKGTPADLNLFYKTVIKAIREVDTETPIILDSGFYANPYALQILDPASLGDSKLIYSIHHYEPARFLASRKKGHDKYPGSFPTGELDIPGDEDAQAPFAPVEYWDRKKIGSYFQVVADWMKRYRIAKSRMYVAEFGGNRQAEGLIDYFRDFISFLNEKGWHWSFYAYREDDSFPQMDYELGTNEVPEIYWKCSKDYTCEDAGVYRPNSLWTVIANGLR
jgi:endoglucanase